MAAVWPPKIEPKENIPRFNGTRLWPPHNTHIRASEAVETGSGFGNCIMVRLGAREIVKLNNKAQKKHAANPSRDDGFIMSTLAS